MCAAVVRVCHECGARGDTVGVPLGFGGGRGLSDRLQKAAKAVVVVIPQPRLLRAGWGPRNSRRVPFGAPFQARGKDNQIKHLG